MIFSNKVENLEWTRTPPTEKNVGEFWVASDMKESFAGVIRMYGKIVCLDNGINQYDTFAMAHLGYWQFIGPLPMVRDVRETDEEE